MKKYKKLSLIALALGLVLIGCDNPKQKKTLKKQQTAQSGEGYTLLKTNCYACHNPNTESHDAIIAPPMIAVKKRYSMQHQTKEAFVKAVVAWASNPTAENALMKGAVTRFKVMPKQPFKTADLEKIAAYIYDNDIEVPSWFAAHEKQMHGKGGKDMMQMNHNIK